MNNKHLVTYLGIGMWKDAEGKMWGTNNSNKDVVASRTFKNKMTEDEFMESRKDIKFMVNYGQMKMDSIVQDIEDKEDTKVEDKKIEGKKEDVKVETPATQAVGQTINIALKK